MAQILTTELIPDIEKSFRRVSLGGERAMTDSDLGATGLSRFSVEDLIRKAEYAAVRVVATASSTYLRSARERLSPSEGAFDLSGTLRLLGGRVSVGGVPALRRTRQDHLDKESVGMSASNAHPVYVYEDARLDVYDDGENPSEAEAQTIALPERTHLSDASASFSDGEVSVSSGEAGFSEDNVGTVLRLGSDIEAKITGFTSGSVAQIDYEGADVTGPGRWYSPAYATLDERFHWPLVYLAVAQAHMTTGNFNAAQSALSAYEDAMSDFYAVQFDLRDIE